MTAGTRIAQLVRVCKAFHHLDGLDMRIDDRPLTFLIEADLIAPVDVATIHSICPNHIGMHGREDSLDLATIEEFIDLP